MSYKVKMVKGRHRFNLWCRVEVSGGDDVTNLPGAGGASN